MGDVVYKKLLAFCAALVTGCASTAPQSHKAVELETLAWKRSLEIEVKSSTKVSRGSASWLSSDLIITASHLFMDMSENAAVRVGSRGMWVDVEILAADDPAFRDLAILRVLKGSLKNESTVKPVVICKKQLVPAQEVFVVSGLHGSGSVSFGSPDYVTQHKGRSWTSHLTGYYPEGTSGGAVYSLYDGCLAGVVSRRRESSVSNSVQVYTTQIVGSDDISAFVGEYEIDLGSIR